jgi:eukaryotic-like serine/threonine-protein kinase
VAEERGPRPGATRDAADAVEPGTVSRLLLEIAQASEETFSASWRASLEPGDVVGRYAIRREIGRGGFGAVYEAFDPQLGRTVALKALQPGRKRHLHSEEWIQKEAEAVAKLDHPAIVTIHDVGTCPAGAYLVMELLKGETLANRIEKGPIPVDEALQIAEQMAEGLAHAHSRGVLHRDLKPANVFLCADGRVKLLDFGLAHLLGTDGSSGAGTPAYMAPEQAAGLDVDERADVYAAAMVLGEMLTGRRPVEPATPRGPSPGPPISRTERMWEEKPAHAPPAPPSTSAPDLDGVPRPLARALATGLSGDPSSRPRDGGAWLDELRAARQRLERPRRTRRVAALTAAGIAIGLAATGFATWRIWERQIPGARPTVAVADFANETGEGELDAMSGLLITALEQGTQLRVLTRSRMLDVLKQLGKTDVQRIDEPLAREVGREARARALLLASVRKLGGDYVVEMRALDPLHDEYIFTAREQASAKEAIFPLVDRLAAATRRRLGVGASDGPPAPPVASITTGDLRAWALLSRSRQALDQNRPDEAFRLASEAIQVDPGFSLAHFQAAQASHWNLEHGPAEERRQLEAAERHADRLPEKERLSLQALRAYLDGNWEENVRLREQVAEAHPLDKEAVAFAGDARFHAWQHPAALRHFERALALDPGYRLIRGHVIDSILASPEPQRHLEWIRAQVAQTGEEKGAQRWLRAYGKLFLHAGSEAEAEEAFRRAAAIDGVPWHHLAQLNQLSSFGRPVEAERRAREAIAAEGSRPGGARPGYLNGLRLALGWALVAQGRMTDVLEVLATIDPGPVATARSRLTFGLVAGSAAEVREAARIIGSQFLGDEPGTGGHTAVDLLRGGRPELGARAALGLLEMGFPEDAGRVVAAVRRSAWVGGLFPGELLLYDAAGAWAAGDLGAAEAAARNAATIAPTGPLRVDGLLYLGLIQEARGDRAGATATLETARQHRWPPSFPATDARILHALARSYEQLGNAALARERIEELLRLWVNADPDLPRLAEAKAMQARLASAAPSTK